MLPSRVTTICCVIEIESQFAVMRLQERFIHSDWNQLHQTVRSIPPSSSSSSILNTGWTFLYSLLCLSLSLTCLVKKKYKKIQKSAHLTYINIIYPSSQFNSLHFSHVKKILKWTTSTIPSIILTGICTHDLPLSRSLYMQVQIPLETQIFFPLCGTSDSNIVDGTPCTENSVQSTFVTNHRIGTQWRFNAIQMITKITGTKILSLRFSAETSKGKPLHVTWLSAGVTFGVLNAEK